MRTSYLVSINVGAAPKGISAKASARAGGFVGREMHIKESKAWSVACTEIVRGVSYPL